MGLYRTQSGELIEATLQSESSLTEQRFSRDRFVDDGKRAFAKAAGGYPSGFGGTYRYEGETGTVGFNLNTIDQRDPGLKHGPKESILISAWLPGGSPASKAAIKALRQAMGRFGKARMSGSGESVEVEVPPDKAMDAGEKIWAALGKSVRASVGAPKG